MPSTSNSNAIDTLLPSLSNFGKRKDQNAMTPAKVHCDLFAEMLFIGPTAKMIINDWKTYVHPKELPLGKDYADTFTAATVNNRKFNSIKA